MAGTGNAAREPIEVNVAVIGKTGVGKSSILYSLTKAAISEEEDRPEIADWTKDAERGTTKSIWEYDGPTIGDRKFTYWDMPGIGDRDTGALPQLLAQINHLLKVKVKMDAVIFCVSATSLTQDFN